MDETVIITYSPKYKAYQQRIRAGQIERAIRIMQSSDKARKGKNPNDPSRFIQKTAVTGDGEIAQKQIFQLDEERIREEAMYDGICAEVHQQTPLGDRRKLPDHENRIRSKNCFCKTGRQHKSTFPDLLHQSSGVPTAGKKAFRRIHLQRNFEDTPGNEYDPAVQRQRLHSFLQTHETDRYPAHSLRFPNGL